MSRNKKKGLPLPKDFVRHKGLKVEGKKVKLRDIITEYPDISHMDITYQEAVNNAINNGEYFKLKGR